MSYRFHVEHESCYRYSDVVHSSYNEARITPMTTPGQLVLDSRVEIRPVAAAQRYVDYWGSIVHAFDLHQPHRELLITARSVVETSDQTAEPAEVAWGVLRTAKLQDEFAEFLSATERVPLDPRLSEAARQISAAHAPREAVASVLEWVRDQLTYTPGATGVHTSAITAWDGGKGVCQDFAHLALALTRAMGLPSRYCSGYLHPDPDAAIGDTHTGESHAWIELWVGDWIALDPTVGRAVNDRYVLVARGRDYGDVSPIKGIFHGGPTSRVEVAIRLTRLA